MAQDALIELRNLSKVFYTEELETWALNDVHLDIRRGEYLAISGPSGCGKSTLLSLIGLLDTCTSGSYKLAGQDVAGLGSSERAGIRNREIGFVFQAFNLIGEMTVYENVELPLTYRSDLSGRVRRQRVDEALDWVDMPHRSRHFPAQLSGGQQQRVAIARALAGQPKVLLADEPTGNLDSKNAGVVMDLLDQLHARGSTICIVTHDAASAGRAQRQVVLHDGRVVDDQTTESAWRNRNAEIAS
jgi:putative ABC transport system ATP-binding protein